MPQLPARVVIGTRSRLFAADRAVLQGGGRAQQAERDTVGRLVGEDPRLTGSCGGSFGVVTACGGPELAALAEPLTPPRDLGGPACRPAGPVTGACRCLARPAR
ncbi:MAG: hypothetical protein JO037_09620, partial [Actinobacteria bacterium]|nr:hypothetical protein [Actinomycetota bacterium]